MQAAAARETILVVDDEPQVLVALEDLLSDEFLVLKSESAENALHVAEREPNIAVVISDQRMPKMHGDELFKRLRGRFGAERILATGFADLTAVIRAVNDGQIFAYVTKPWDPEDLRVKIHRAAGHFRLARELAQERKLLDDLMNSVPDAIYFKDTNLRFQRINQSTTALVGELGVSEVVGRSMSELWPGVQSVLDAEEKERAVLRDLQPTRDSVASFLVGGERRWFSTTKAPICDHLGTPVGLVGIARDVTSRIQMEEALKSREEQLRLTFLASSAGLFDWNLITGMVEHSPSVSMMMAGEAQGTLSLPELEARVHPEDLERVRAALQAHFVEHAPLRAVELRSLIGGVYRWFEINAQAVWDSAGRPVRLVGSSIDIHERKQQEARLDFLAYYDDLTGLPNRRLLSDRLSQQLALCAEKSLKLAVVLLDIERFRQINETLGRRAGDDALIEIARRLRLSTESNWTIARFASNTFAVIASSLETEATVAQWIEQSLAALGQSAVVAGTELRLSARIGIAMFPSDGKDVDALLANAEAALKNGKDGAQRYLFYTSAMNERVAERLRLETRLRNAIEQSEFLLHYQPKIELKTGKVVGLEALIRWAGPDGKLIPPISFIPLLEDTGMIVEVGAWVMDCAARQHAEWTAQGLNPPRIAVNVSPLQLGQPTFMDGIEAILARYPLAKSGLDLEITESVLMEDLHGNTEKLRRAREAGLRVSIDDFGTGYSSLGYISRLPIDALKIDRSFVARMTEDPQEMSIVTTIISLAHALDLKVIAEGVETAQQAQLLRLLKCDQIQGYFVARPQAADATEKLLATTFDLSGGRS
ncbi:MAG: EAL domain-containing protein [Polyangiaceae bacterium]